MTTTIKIVKNLGYNMTAVSFFYITFFFHRHKVTYKITRLNRTLGVADIDMTIYKLIINISVLLER